MAAEQRCRDISRVKTIPPAEQPKHWKYILLPQNIYQEMEGQSLRAIINRCESYLAFLKMKQE